MTKQDLDYPDCPLCRGTEEAMYDAVINGNDNQLIELVEQGVNKI